MPDFSSAPSYRYANLARGACFDELAARKIVFRRVDEAPGVLAPVRIPSGVGGVRYRTGLPPEKARTSPFEVFDCRLVLALDDLSAILRPHGIDDVIIFSGWRPPGKTWPKDKAARRHPGGLAVDVKTLRSTVDPELRLEVEDDYGGKIDAPSCGPSAVAPEEPSSRTVLLRELVCEIVASRVFTSVLTPNHDEAHRNHLHLDLATDVTWRIVR